MLEVLDTYDWQEAFGYAGESNAFGSPCIVAALPTAQQHYNLSAFTREDVKEITGMSEGENDGANWLIYGQLKDGRWFFLSAGCDYTGWDCQASGVATIAKSKTEIERFGMGTEDRERLGVPALPIP